MIFISYRIADCHDVVDRLDTDLARVFGRDAVFRDRKRLQGGDRWPGVLEANAINCTVMLVVIGPRWQTAAYTDPERVGQLRLYDDRDWVRKEITLALASGRVVIPVLVNGQGAPARGWLDRCGLGELANCQGVKIRVDEYDADLAKLVGVLHRHCKKSEATPSPPPVKAPKVWTPAVLYPLQPAPHFAGREKLLAELAAWARSPDDPNRVVAVVAAGGTGKTALAERVLNTLRGHTAAGVFVWSFYENPQTEQFLWGACEYLFGEAPKETGGLLEAFQRDLRADWLPHLFILDGLELVQATGHTGRPRGEIEEPFLKRLVRWLAAGHGTRAKALITSRFPLPDLADWTDRGFRLVDLDDLDAPAARSVLRRRGVKGGDTELDALADEVHRHALTVDVLGSYLGTFHDGDPSKAPSFDPEFLRDTDPKAARLNRVLDSYAEKLDPRERDLLARLSAFPRGISRDLIGHLIGAGGKVAGALSGCGPDDVQKFLERLRALGLVFKYDAGGMATFTAHPFLRLFFEKLLHVSEAQDVREAVRAKMAVGLVGRPSERPTDIADLDFCERLIEVTRLAGQPQQAFDLYWNRIGPYHHLGSSLGEDSRGLRILSAFVPDGNPETCPDGLNLREYASLLDQWGLYASNLGDLHTVRRAYRVHQEIRRRLSDRSTWRLDFIVWR